MPVSTYDWLRQIPSSLLRENKTPLLAAPPNFPLDAFLNSIKKSLEISHLEMEYQPPEIRSTERFFEGFPEPRSLLSAASTGFEGSVSLLLAEGDLNQLFKLFLGVDKHALEEECGAAFSDFLGLEILQSLSETGYFPFNWQLVESGFSEEKPVLTIDIALKIEGLNVKTRLFLPEPFLDYLRHTYQKPAIAGPLGYKLPVTLHIEGGSTTLTNSDWEALKPGDFLLADRCPYLEKSRVHLTVKGVTIFRGKIKDGNIKILEYPFYLEGEEEMTSRTPENNDENDAFAFEGEEEESFAEGEDFDEEMEYEEEEELFEEEGEDSGFDEPLEGAEELPHESKKFSQAPSAPSLSKAELPVTVVFEVTRLQMSIEKLMELQPGNLLELNSMPSDGIDLTVGGRKIGRGELLKIGEALGVRILELG